MRVVSFLSAMVSLSALLKASYDRLYAADGSVPELESALHTQFRSTIESMERLLESIYVAFGSSVLGLVIDPPDPLWQADQVFNEFKRCYRDFVAEFNSLISEIRISGDDVRKRLGTEWLTLDNIGRVFEKGKVEWDEVAAEGSLRIADPVINNQRRFNTHLAGKFREFLHEEMDIRDFEPLDMVSSLLRDNEIVCLTGARLRRFMDDEEGR